MRFQRRPEKTCHKKPLWGKNVQEIWVGAMAQAPSDLKPILRRLYKNEIRTADPTGLGAWYLKKKYLNKEKTKKLIKTKRKERGWFWSLDDNHVLYPFLYTLHFYPWCPGLELRPLLYLVPPRLLFRPYSLAHSSEITYAARRESRFA